MADEKQNDKDQAKKPAAKKPATKRAARKPSAKPKAAAKPKKETAHARQGRCGGDLQDRRQQGVRGSHLEGTGEEARREEAG